jgi:hypothetical protein
MKRCVVLKKTTRREAAGEREGEGMKSAEIGK